MGEVVKFYLFGGGKGGGVKGANVLDVMYSRRRRRRFLQGIKGYDGVQRELILLNSVGNDVAVLM